LAYQYVWNTDEPIIEEPITEKPQDETADWQIYRNEMLELELEKIGFTVQYPNDWDYTMIGPKLFFGPEDVIKNLEIGKNIEDKSLGIMISVYEKILYDRGILPYKKSSEYFLMTSSDIEVDGIQGTKYVFEYLVDRLCYHKGDKTISVDLKLDNGYLSIHLFDYQKLDTFQKILSTFRFID
ncbi:MAG: hypothetical protein U9Q16_01490, partial [Patescibacteria group bacterium]|nr:hypothetical protein [Patescibacteria group bacterium]